MPFRNISKRILLGFMGVGLFAILTNSVVFALFVPDVQPTLDKELAELLPSNVKGWRSEAVPLSSTPEGEERVLNVLDLDDVFCRQYTSGDTQIMIYAAYWYPGSEPYSSVAIHNPDSCWVIAGWDVKDRISNRNVEIAGGSLKPHEWGLYEKNGNGVHVIFWHLLGGEPNEYLKHMIWTSSGIDSFKRQFYFVFNLYQMGLELGRDQLFIRVSSNKPFEDLEGDPDFERLMRKLSPLGIFAEES